MMKKKEFSKKLLLCTSSVFCFNLIAALLFSWCGRDTSIFMYSIPAAGGVWATSVGFYYNKAKTENMIKIKIGFIKSKIEIYENLSPEMKNFIKGDVNFIEDEFNNSQSNDF